MQVIGLVRFSYPASTAFQINFENPQLLEAYLYSKARMIERFALFEHICLPALRQQSDPDFHLVVVVGESLPALYQKKLHDLLQGFPQSTIVPLPAMPHGDAMTQAVETVKNRGNARDWIAHFRMDDDDTVSKNFVRDVRMRFALLHDLAVDAGKLGLDYNYGFTLQADANGVKSHVGHHRLWTPGQVVFLPQNDPRTSTHFPHHKLDRTMPVITYPRPSMFVRSKNLHNDSNKSSHFAMKLEAVTPDHRRILKNRFAISVDALATATASL